MAAPLDDREFVLHHLREVDELRRVGDTDLSRQIAGVREDVAEMRDLFGRAGWWFKLAVAVLGMLQVTILAAIPIVGGWYTEAARTQARSTAVQTIERNPEREERLADRYYARGRDDARALSEARDRELRQQLGDIQRQLTQRRPGQE